MLSPNGKGNTSGRKHLIMTGWGKTYFLITTDGNYGQREDAEAHKAMKDLCKDDTATDEEVFLDPQARDTTRSTS